MPVRLQMPLGRATELSVVLALAMSAFSCGDSAGDEQPPTEWGCAIADGDEPDSSSTLGCEPDFTLLASAPLDASIPGARSVKTVIDQLDGDRLYFQNSKRYPIHWDFIHAHLSGNGNAGRILPPRSRYHGPNPGEHSLRAEPPARPNWNVTPYDGRGNSGPGSSDRGYP